MKRTIPVLIASIVGFVLIVAHFIPIAESWGETAMIWFDILASVAMILGAINILKVSLQKVSNQRPGWGYAGITVIAFLVTLVFGLAKIGNPPSADFPEFAWSGDYVQEGSPLWWTYQYLYYPMSSTMYSLLAFFIASAAFRAFRAKNAEATILLGTAFIVLIGQTYAATFTTWLGPFEFQNMTQFIMDVFNKAGNRAITLGIALGVVSLSLRVLLGLDRSYLGTD